MAWTQSDIPDLTNHVILITGATSGLGLNAARLLFAHNATIIMACRNADKMSAISSTLLRSIESHGRLLQLQVDLCSLADLKHLPTRLSSHGISYLDALLLNAGVSSSEPLHSPTGLDGVFVTNVLAHWQLTGVLLPLLRACPRVSRVVPVSSLTHRLSTNIDYGVVRGAREDYNGPQMYAATKLAAHWFAAELNRRLKSVGARVEAVVAHPGYAESGMTDPKKMDRWFSERMFHLLGTPFRQSGLMGAMPLVRAVVDESVPSGEYVGPGGFFELWGAPIVGAKRAAAADDTQKAIELWAVCEQLAGFVYNFRRN